MFQPFYQIQVFFIYFLVIGGFVTWKKTVFGHFSRFRCFSSFFGYWRLRNMNSRLSIKKKTLFLAILLDFIKPGSFRCWKHTRKAPSHEISLKTVSSLKISCKTGSSLNITLKTVSSPKLTLKTGSSLDITLKNSV